MSTATTWKRNDLGAWKRHYGHCAATICRTRTGWMAFADTDPSNPRIGEFPKLVEAKREADTVAADDLRWLRLLDDPSHIGDHCRI